MPAIIHCLIVYAISGISLINLIFFFNHLLEKPPPEHVLTDCTPPEPPVTLNLWDMGERLKKPSTFFQSIYDEDLNPTPAYEIIKKALNTK